MWRERTEPGTGRGVLSTRAGVIAVMTAPGFVMMRNEQEQGSGVQRACDDSARCPTPRWVWVYFIARTFIYSVLSRCQPRSSYIVTSVSETLLH